MIDTLNRCRDIEAQLQSTYNGDLCNGITINTNNCMMDCVQSSFYANAQDTYNCLIKLALYTINYGPIYVSEIYHFLATSQLLENNFSGLNRPIEVMSLGCGFGPDDIALSKYRDNHRLDIDFNYMGFDIEARWNYITGTNALPIVYNVLDGFSCENIDILFLNKLFSTLKNHNLHNDFFNVLENALDTLPNGSFVIFNDINHYNMGRDDFNNFAINNNLEVVGQYYFNVNGAYQDNYTEIPSTENICNIPPNLPWTPKLSPNKTVFFLYKKVV